LITARFGSSSVTVGSGLELRVITAAIIGGAGLSGGEGSVLGALLGVLIGGATRYYSPMHNIIPL